MGFTLLFFSLTTTMLAFVAAFLLVFRFQKPSWTSTLIHTAPFLPVSRVALTQFPLYFTLNVTLLKFYKWIKEALRGKQFQSYM
ncbi:hypothetical protein Pint_09604 [Pistacia integerrima]|uniref:Uncharacterized protein n=1 Tax=Pistacia integerrima TaxID=434235 RepID=A0ACC0XE46_9ROSI|nr:hypothetical protein Pint_09604 [Pistacia integerrima]